MGAGSAVPFRHRGRVAFALAGHEHDATLGRRRNARGGGGPEALAHAGWSATRPAVGAPIDS